MAAVAAAAGGLVPYVVTVRPEAPGGVSATRPLMCVRWSQAHKPTAVTQAVVGHFTGPDQMNLIIGCATRPPG